MALKVVLKVDAASARMVKEAFPSARLSGEGCELSIQADGPAKAASDLRRLRDALQRSKDFKKPRRSTSPK